MRKLLIVAAAVMAVACSVREGGVQSVRFYVSGVRSGDFGVKAVTDDQVGAALDATAPTGTVELYLESTQVSQRRYNVSTGDQVSVPVGTYRVSGRYAPSTKSIVTIENNKVYTEPEYVIDTTVDIVEGVDSYVLPSRYDCWALVVDKESIASQSYRLPMDISYHEFNVPAVSGSVGVVYVSTSVSWPSNRAVTFRFHPVDVVNYEDKEYGIVNQSGGSGVLKVEPGKWYLFDPNGVTSQSGNIGIEFDGWEKGNE